MILYFQSLEDDLGSVHDNSRPGSNIRTASFLASKAEISEADVKRFMSYWEKKGVIKARRLFSASDDGIAGDIVYELVEEQTDLARKDVEEVSMGTNDPSSLVSIMKLMNNKHKINILI